MPRNLEVKYLPTLKHKADREYLHTLKHEAQQQSCFPDLPADLILLKTLASLTSNRYLLNRLDLQLRSG